MSLDNVTLAALSKRVRIQDIYFTALRGQALFMCLGRVRGGFDKFLDHLSSGFSSICTLTEIFLNPNNSNDSPPTPINNGYSLRGKISENVMVLYFVYLVLPSRTGKCWQAFPNKIRPLQIQ